MRAIFLGSLLALLAAACSSASSGSGSTGLGSTSGSGGAGGAPSVSCRSDAECTSAGQSCFFHDPCFGRVGCEDSSLAPCVSDTNCNTGETCRVCDESQSPGTCFSCGEAGCPTGPLETCTQDQDCPRYCIHGFCSAILGTCGSCP